MSSDERLLKLPADVRKLIGYALHFAQQGGQHQAAKVLKASVELVFLKSSRTMWVAHIEPSTP